MTPAEREAQRRSFAYGNTKLANEAVTRELIDRAADRLPAPVPDRPISPARVVAAALTCALLMTASSAAAVHFTWWWGLGIPLAPLVAALATCRPPR